MEHLNSENSLLPRIKKFYWGLLSGTHKKQIKNSLIKLVENRLIKIEGSLLKENAEPVYAPIFIIGPPRSGSTLLYQLIACHFNVCYFTNLMTRFPKSPVCLSKVLSLIQGCNPPNSFESRYGETEGWKSPNQGIPIWFRWFPQDHSYIEKGVLSRPILNEMRNTILLMQKKFNAPFVNKWQANTVRMLPISEAFPEALFIRIKRDPALTAQSILHGKRTMFDDEKEWFSTRPRRYETLRNKNILEQVCEQVFCIEEDIDRDCKVVGEDKFMTVEYEDLCKSPQIIMNNIEEFYTKNQKFGRLKSRCEIPSSFLYDRSVQVSQDEFKFIENYFSRKNASSNEM